MGELYRLDFSNGKSYVGITTKTAKERFRTHIKAKNKGGNTLVYKAWEKYGVPILVTLAKVENFDLFDTEVRAIKIFETLHPNGYNMTPGGEISPMLIPEIAKKQKLRKYTEEQNKANSDRLKKFYQENPEARSANAERQKVIQNMPNAREENSKRMTGKFHSEEHKRRRSAWTKISHGTPEYKAAQSARLKISLNTPEARAIKSERMKAVWVKRKAMLK